MWSHTKQVFSGDPADFSEWRKAWESFVEDAMAASGGQGRPDIALLRVLEGWLDEATKSSMHNEIKANPALRYSDFFLELCREFQVESNFTKRKKWRDTTLKHKEGQPLFTAWQNFKAALSDSLSCVGPPQSDDLREHVFRQLPKNLREMDVWEEIFPRGFRDKKYWKKWAKSWVCVCLTTERVRTLCS